MNYDDKPWFHPWQSENDEDLNKALRGGLRKKKKVWA
jgi:hypothetical protein